jgi:hypothetical protein
MNMNTYLTGLSVPSISPLPEQRRVLRRVEVFVDAEDGGENDQVGQEDEEVGAVGDLIVMGNLNINHTF